MKMPSVMSHNFSEVPNVQLQRSTFNRSHGLKTTFDSGLIVPVFVDEVLPGDTFNLKMSAFGRLATPLHPFMDNVYMDTFFFFVPNRLIWDNWEKFNGEQDNPTDSTDFLIPQVTTPSGGYANESLFDYFGVPTKVDIAPINALHSRAYNLIYNEWFRDENLIDSATVDKGDGPDTDTNYTILKRGKRHDYFTSSLPWPQKGEDVLLPLGSQAPVVTDAELNNQTLALYSTGSEAYGNIKADGAYAATTGVISDANNALYTDLTNATAATINTIREAFQVQKLYEKDARGGTRYTEIIRAHFGVTSPDARLQRPEYLGGKSTRINVNPVAQTSSTDDTTPQGNLAAIGTLTSVNNGFTKSFTEHGVILGFVSVRADLTYQQGLNRMWSRQTRLDYYWPSFAHLGEQAVLNKEIYADGSATDDEVFGYQERYAEYRYKPSNITGKFRSNDDQSLDSWHLAQDYDSVPSLNQTFIEEDVPLERVLAVTDEPQFILDAFFDLKCSRPMPVYSVPGLVDHF